MEAAQVLDYVNSVVGYLGHIATLARATEARATYFIEECAAKRRRHDEATGAYHEHPAPVYPGPMESTATHIRRPYPRAASRGRGRGKPRIIRRVTNHP